MSNTEATYRLIVLGDRNNVGQTALTPELARLVPGDLVRGNQRLGMERTDWVDHFGKPKVARTVLVDAESAPAEWTIGVEPESEKPAPGNPVLIRRLPLRRV
jgi:hypothetical protein